MGRRRGQCNGIIINNHYGRPGIGAHEIPKWFESYFNVYAGPFCPYHLALFQIQAIQEYDDNFPALAGSYEDKRLDLIDQVREMEAADVRGELVHA